MKILNEGESKKFKSTWTEITVTAECVDCDTPYIEIANKYGVSIDLTDGDAEELIELLKKALKILPSSK